MTRTMSSTVTKTTGRIERMGVTLDRVNEAAHREREALWAASEARDRERKRQDLDALRLGEIPPEQGFYAYWRRFFGRAA
jgi:hypothetical protein